jgi:F-box and WD-40 domain protein CDC4
MDPPKWPRSKRRTALLHSSNSSNPLKCKSDGSPSPFTSNSKTMQSGIQNRRPRSTQTVSIGWKEGQDMVSHRASTLQIELAECVETQTVTTTTTTKRSYPPLLVRQRRLSNLDSKEYPLASKDTPPELTNFSFELDGQASEGDESHTLVYNFPHLLLRNELTS